MTEDYVAWASHQHSSQKQGKECPLTATRWWYPQPRAVKRRSRLRARLWQGPAGAERSEHPRLPTRQNPRGQQSSGKVLIAGGRNGTTSLNRAQLYSPSAGSWIAAGNLNAARQQHTATLLPNGKVLVTGGINGTTVLATAANYNPATGAGTWTATTGPMPGARKLHAATLISTTNTQLNGKVLVVGGSNGTASQNTVYLYDPAQLQFSTLNPLTAAREGHTATALSNTKILLAGGKSGTTTINTAIQFDPTTGPGS